MSCGVYTIPHTYTEGDTLPQLECVLEDTDLSGYTITLRLERPGTTALAKTATAVDLTKGQFKFVWTTTDLVAGHSQQMSIEFQSSGGALETVSGLLLDVEDRIS